MKRKLEMDDVMVGMYITVLRGSKFPLIANSPKGLPQVVIKESCMFNGRVLEVVGIDLPYIVVLLHTNNSEFRPHRYSLDLRTVEVMKLTSDYINAYCPKLEIHSPDPDIETGKEIEDQMIEDIFKDL